MTEPNAHIRSATPGVKQITPAEDAARLINDPALVNAFKALRESAIRQIEALPIDGRPESQEIQNELCRVLRTVGGIRRALSLALQGQQLRDHNFRATVPPPDDKDIA